MTDWVRNGEKDLVNVIYNSLSQNIFPVYYFLIDLFKVFLPLSRSAQLRKDWLFSSI